MEIQKSGNLEMQQMPVNKLLAVDLQSWATGFPLVAKLHKWSWQNLIIKSVQAERAENVADWTFTQCFNKGLFTLCGSTQPISGPLPANIQQHASLGVGPSLPTVHPPPPPLYHHPHPTQPIHYNNPVSYPMQSPRSAMQGVGPFMAPPPPGLMPGMNTSFNTGMGGVHWRCQIHSQLWSSW